jgi:hypothetical protein
LQALAPWPEAQRAISLEVSGAGLVQIEAEPAIESESDPAKKGPPHRG